MPTPWINRTFQPILAGPAEHLRLFPVWLLMLNGVARHPIFPPMDRQIFLDHIRQTRFALGDRAAAQRDARRIARYLIRQGAARVFGVGSAFVSSRRFTSRSDIDLAVEALDPKRFLAASAKAAEMTDFALDVISVESASEAMLRTIREEGVEL